MDGPVGSRQTSKRTPKPWYWLRDAQGYGSITVTLVLFAFWVTTIAYILSTVESIGNIKLRPFDIGAASTYLIPILTLYFGRKWTDSHSKEYFDDKPDDKKEKK